MRTILPPEEVGGDASFPVASEPWEHAEWWYDRHLRRQLETCANLGKYVVVNPDSSEWILGDDPTADDMLEVSRRGWARFGGTRLVGMRVGYPAVDAIGVTLETYPHLRGEEQSVG